MALPVMGNPGSKKRRRKARKAKRSGMASCALRLRGRSGASRSHRSKARKAIRAYKKSRKATRRKHRKSLYTRYSDLLTGGGGKHRERLMRKLKKRLDAQDKGKKTREYKKAARAEDRGLGYSFFGANPRRRKMARHRRHRKNPPSATAGLTAGLSNKNIVGVLPYIGGAILNGVVRGLVGKQFPAVNSGIPGAAVGVLTAGLVGWAGHQVNGQIGEAMLDGALIEVGTDAFDQIKKGTFGMSGLWDSSSPFNNNVLDGLGDYAMLRQADNAYQMGEGETQSQYPMPTPGAHAMHHGGGHVSPPPQMAHPDEHAEVAAVIADTDMSAM